MACLEIQVWLDRSRKDSSHLAVRRDPITCSEEGQSSLPKLRTQATRPPYSCLLLKDRRKAHNSNRWAKVRVRLKARRKDSSLFSMTP